LRVSVIQFERWSFVEVVQLLLSIPAQVEKARCKFEIHATTEVNRL
jgi:hypothetical protein